MAGDSDSLDVLRSFVVTDYLHRMCGRNRLVETVCEIIGPQTLRTSAVFRLLGIVLLLVEVWLNLLLNKKPHGLRESQRSAHCTSTSRHCAPLEVSALLVR